MSDFSEKTDKFLGRNRRGENYDVPPVYLIGLMDMEIRQPDREFWRERMAGKRMRIKRLREVRAGFGEHAG